MRILEDRFVLAFEKRMIPETQLAVPPYHEATLPFKVILNKTDLETHVPRHGYFVAVELPNGTVQLRIFEQLPSESTNINGKVLEGEKLIGVGELWNFPDGTQINHHPIHNNQVGVFTYKEVYGGGYTWAQPRVYADAPAIGLLYTEERGMVVHYGASQEPVFPIAESSGLWRVRKIIEDIIGTRPQIRDP